MLLETLPALKTPHLPTPHTTPLVSGPLALKPWQVPGTRHFLAAGEPGYKSPRSASGPG